MMDDEVLIALKTLEEPLALRKIGDKQLNESNCQQQILIECFTTRP